MCPACHGQRRSGPVGSQREYRNGEASIRAENRQRRVCCAEVATLENGDNQAALIDIGGRGRFVQSRRGLGGQTPLRRARGTPPDVGTISGAWRKNGAW